MTGSMSARFQARPAFGNQGEGESLLGHKSIKVREKHYAPWIRARQEQLEAHARRVWETHPETSGKTNHTYNPREKTSRAN